jgi:MoaA/NifB/PqqE/SkfB family radical SAM enzyme
MKKFEAIYFDLTGTCNAQCPYCMTGPGKLRVKNFIEVDTFKKAILKLKDSGIIFPDTVVSLYNWGEPFIHPKIESIIEVMNELDVFYALSTNASLYHDLNPSLVKKLKHIIFSISGFSQASYDKIHGFKFEKIKENIRKFVYTARASGYKEQITIFFHVYQFNLLEIEKAKEFARELNVNLYPFHAIMNEWDKMEQFVEDKLAYDDLLKMSQALFLFNFKDLINNAPKDYFCPQWNYLTIDEQCNVLVCCQTPKYDKSYQLGNILTDSFDEILFKKQNNDVCAKCLKSGLAYYINNSLPMLDITPEVRQK